MAERTRVVLVALALLVAACADPFDDRKVLRTRMRYCTALVSLDTTRADSIRTFNHVPPGGSWNCLMLMQWDTLQ